VLVLQYLRSTAAAPERRVRRRPAVPGHGSGRGQARSNEEARALPAGPTAAAEGSYIDGGEHERDEELNGGEVLGRGDYGGYRRGEGQGREEDSVVAHREGTWRPGE
jgi:hypothetical protein